MPRQTLEVRVGGFVGVGGVGWGVEGVQTQTPLYTAYPCNRRYLRSADAPEGVFRQTRALAATSRRVHVRPAGRWVPRMRALATDSTLGLAKPE